MGAPPRGVPDGGRPARTRFAATTTRGAQRAPRLTGGRTAPAESDRWPGRELHVSTPVSWAGTTSAGTRAELLIRDDAPGARHRRPITAASARSHLLRPVATVVDSDHLLSLVQAGRGEGSTACRRGRGEGTRGRRWSRSSSPPGTRGRDAATPAGGGAAVGAPPGGPVGLSAPSAAATARRPRGGARRSRAAPRRCGGPPRCASSAGARPSARTRTRGEPRSATPRTVRPVPRSSRDRRGAPGR